MSQLRYPRNCTLLLHQDLDLSGYSQLALKKSITRFYCNIDQFIASNMAMAPHGVTRMSPRFRSAQKESTLVQ